MPLGVPHLNVESVTNEGDGQCGLAGSARSRSSRSWPTATRDGDGRGPPSPRGQLRDLLQLEGEVRRAAHVGRPQVEDAGDGERSTEAAAGLGLAGHGPF